MWVPRIRKLALFADLGYAPHPGQVEIHLSQAPRRVVACGVQWGKTLCAAYEAIAAALEPADESLGWIVAPSFELCDRVLDTVRRVAEEHLGHRLVPLPNARRRILLRNMAGGLSEIRGKSADRPDSLLGEGLDWLIVDEAACLRGDIWHEHLSQRLVDRQGWALVASTPRGQASWFYELFERGQGADPDFESWSRPSLENPRLDSTAIEKERQRLPLEVFAQEYGGEFLTEYGVVCKVCGGPDPNGIAAIVLEGEEQLHHCDRCDRPVDEEGKPIGAPGAGGRLYLKVIRLHDSEQDAPAPDSVGVEAG